MSRRVLCLPLLCWGLAHAAPAPDDQPQRDRIRQQRQAVEAQHLQKEEACRHQFVVTPCLEKVRVEKHEALRELRAQELMLDEAQRHRRSLEQARRTAEKAQEAEETQDSVQKAAKPARAAKPGRVHSPRPPASAPDRSAEEKRHQERFEERQREIRAHREDVEKRNAARAARKPPQPLASPGSAASR